MTAQAHEQSETARAARSAQSGLSDQARATGERPAELGDDAAGAGFALPPELRARMQHTVGGDLSDVVLHTDSDAGGSAPRNGALAATRGRHVSFAAGRYRPGTVAFEALLAHELAHARQQDGSAPGTSLIGGSRSLEAEADQAAYHAALRLVAPAAADEAAGPTISGSQGHGLQFFLCAPPEPGETVAELPSREQYEATGELAPRAFDEALLEAGPLDWGLPAGELELEGAGAGTAAPGASAGTAPLRRGTRIAESLGSDAPQLSLDAARARVAALEVTYGHVAELISDLSRPGRPLIRPAAMAFLAAGADWETGGPASGSLDLTALGIAQADLVPQDPAALSREIVRSERVLGTTLQALTDLSRLRAVEAQTEARMPDYDSSFALGSVDDVREAYARAADAVLTPRAVSLCNRAIEAHDALGRTLMDLKIEHFAQLGSEHEEIAPSVARMQDWAWRLHEQITELEAALPALQEAAAGDPGLAAMERRFVRKAQLISVSIEALGEWDMAVQAYEYLRSGSALVGYEGVEDIAYRLGQMDDAARAGDLPYLQVLLRDHRADPAVAEYFASLPEIVEWSQLAIGLAITLLAIAVAAPIGIVASGLVTTAMVGAGVAEGSALLLGASFVAHVGAEAVAFTLVSRGLSALVPGMGPTSPLWADLLWNFGLFGLLRGVNLGVRVALTGASRAVVTATALTYTYATLQAYGMVRFTVENARPMTAAEFGRMSLHNLIMLAALSVGTRPLQRPLARLEQGMALRTLRARYGRRFSEIRTERESLERDTAERVESNPEAGREDVADLESRAQDLDLRLRDLVDEVASDPEVTAGLRTELQEVMRDVAEQPLSELLGEAGLEAVVDVQPTGNETVWTYRPGTTPMVLRFLEGAEITHTATELTSGVHTVEVSVPGRGRVQLVEREGRRPPAETVTAPPTAEPTLTEATLRRRVADPANPRDMAAHAELQSRYRRMRISDLVKRLRRGGRWHSAYASEALADGWGTRGTLAEYLSESSIEALRDMARYDPAAADALVERYYRDFTPVQLENRVEQGDNTARYVLENPRTGPAMNAEAEARLVERIWEQRRTRSEAARTEAGEAEAAGNAAEADAARQRSEAALSRGTMGAMETDIPGLTDPVVRGSPRAPTTIDPDAPRPLRPATEITRAQLHAEEQLLNWLIGRLEALRLDAAALEGRRVRIVVDQRVCSYCATGLASGEHAGILVQFGRLYPGIEVQIVDLRSGDYLILNEGRRTLHHRRAGTIED